jgi:2-aminoadipate transaminase
LITNGLLERQVPKLCAAYRTRRDAMLAALGETMPAGIRWTTPEGGMFLLLTLPPEMSGSAISRAALAENVLVVPGDDFHLHGGENTLRLNFSNCAPETIRCGIQRLASLIKTHPA